MTTNPTREIFCKPQPYHEKKPSRKYLHKQEWYTPAEVAVHNQRDDCWVILNGRVLDLTDWLQDQFRRCHCTKFCTCAVKNWYCADDCVEQCKCFKMGYDYCDFKRLASTIMAHAGKDISHWFKGDDWVHYNHPITGIRVPYHRFGADARQPVVPSPRWRPYADPPWWLDERYVVGRGTARTRPIRITNTLIGSTVTLEVCSEETIYQIMRRYYAHNAHQASYTWRYRGRGLKLNKTLAENGIPDERDVFYEVGLPDNLHVPAILIYYNDDLTEDPPKDFCYCDDMDCELRRPDKCFEHIDNISDNIPD